MYYDREGQPVSFVRWSELQCGNVMVAKTSFDGGWVSTIWVGISPSHFVVPLIYETQVFAPGHQLDMECERYATEADAVAGHERWVAKVREADEQS